MHRARWGSMVLLLMAGGVLAADATMGGAASAGASTSTARPTGYLPAESLPNSLALVPPPPASGTAAFGRDEETSRMALELRGSPRWELATRDAVLRFPELAETFSCALNAPIDEVRMPRLVHLLRRTLSDAGRSTTAAKNHYQRARPFMVNDQPICTPSSAEALRGNGSYPSGHSAIGFALALVLAEVAPDRADALIARGRAFGQSRIVCNVHWASDVQEGQLMAAAVVARLHAEPEFRADVEAARAELAAMKAQNSPPVRDCKLEAQALQP
jgi:acid phosphatase (class A)